MACAHKKVKWSTLLGISHTGCKAYTPDIGVIKYHNVQNDSRSHLNLVVYFYPYFTFISLSQKTRRKNGTANMRSDLTPLQLNSAYRTVFQLIQFPWILPSSCTHYIQGNSGKLLPDLSSFYCRHKLTEPHFILLSLTINNSKSRNRQRRIQKG